MSKLRAALSLTSVVAFSGLGCREAQKSVDSAVPVVNDGHGGAAVRTSSAGQVGGTAGVASRTSSSADCDAAEHSFPAVPSADGSCTLKLPAPDHGQTQFLVQPDGRGDLPRDPSHQNGWDYADATGHTVQIFGPTCAALGAGSVHRVCIEYQFVSDREQKRDFAAVNRGEILERLARLPISTWSYKDDDRRARHIGPMAQDFKSSFDFGSTDKTIYPLDENGVALAAIQALNEKVERLASENAALKQQLTLLRKTVR